MTRLGNRGQWGAEYALYYLWDLGPVTPKAATARTLHGALVLDDRARPWTE